MPCTDGLIRCQKDSPIWFIISDMAERFGQLQWSFQITCIEGLESLTTLEVLDLSDNNISRITNLRALTHLRKVNLSANYIGSIECLTELTDVSFMDKEEDQTVMMMKCSWFTSTFIYFLLQNSLTLGDLFWNNDMLLFFEKKRRCWWNEI